MLWNKKINWKNKYYILHTIMSTHIIRHADVPPSYTCRVIHRVDCQPTRGYQITVFEWAASTGNTGGFVFHTHQAWTLLGVHSRPHPSLALSGAQTCLERWHAGPHGPSQARLRESWWRHNTEYMSHMFIRLNYIFINYSFVINWSVTCKIQPCYMMVPAFVNIFNYSTWFCNFYMTLIMCIEFILKRNLF